MDWQLTLGSIVLGTLLPSMLLWAISRKMLIDVAYWELLLISACAASVWQIPVVGVWICLPVSFGFFCLLSGISRIQSLWMALLAYSFCALVGLSALHFANDAPNAGIAEKEVDRPGMLEEILPAVKQFAASAKPSRRKEVPLDTPASIGSAPDWMNRKYNVGGIAKSGGEFRAVINGAIVAKGDELESGAMVVGLEADRVIVRHKGALVALHLAAVL